MSSNSITTRRIAMFGASGGCSLEALKLLAKRHDSAESIEVFVFCRGEKKVKDAFAAEGLRFSTGSTKVTIHKGDALDAESVNDFFRTITADAPLTDVTSSMGGVPVINKLNPLGPVKFAPGMEHICEDSMRNVVNALQNVVAPRQPDGKAPSLIVISSNGIGKSAHDILPFTLKHTIYGAMLKYPHMDKEAMEVFLHQQYGVQSQDFNRVGSTPQPSLLSDRLTILRPSLLTDGAAKNKVRASTTTLKSAWTVSRKDVGAFLTGDCLRLTKPTADIPVKLGNGFVVSY